MFSTVVPCIFTHIRTLISNKTKPRVCSGLHDCNETRSEWRDDSLVALCLCWKQVLCGHSCCPSARCSAGTWWLLVEVRVQPWNKPPTHCKEERSRWSSCAPHTLVLLGRPAASGPGLITGAGRGDDHTTPGVTGSKCSSTLHVAFLWKPACVHALIYLLSLL